MPYKSLSSLKIFIHTYKRQKEAMIWPTSKEEKTMHKNLVTRMDEDVHLQISISLNVLLPGNQNKAMPQRWQNCLCLHNLCLRMARWL
jgi:hypothetical protein